MSRETRWPGSPWRRRRAACAVLGIVSLACYGGNDALTQPEYGFVRVWATASGGDLDADGYEVTLDAAQTRALKNAAVESFHVGEGTHTVRIDKVAANCTVVGPNPQTVSVALRQIVTVSFEIVCVSSGIAVSARTIGPDSPDSLRLAIDDTPPVLVGANGSQAIGRLTPGAHTLTVLAPAHCTVAGGARRSVDVVLAAFAAVALDVSCTPAVRLPKIAYAAEDPGRIVRSIEVVNVDGTGAVRLRVGDAPSWSPDGKTLAFTDVSCYEDYYYGRVCSGGIQAVDPETGNVRRFAGGVGGFHPTWAPGGGTIVFHQHTVIPSVIVLQELAVLSGASSNLNVPGPRAIIQPAWSPDGKRIAFACRWVTYLDLCIANADGTGAVQLSDDGELDQEPAWSPDGTKLAFARYPIGRGDDGSADIAVMDLATRRITVLGKGADPAWSPDGSKLVFAAVDGLFVMNADGSGRTRLTTGAHHAPAWRP